MFESRCTQCFLSNSSIRPTITNCRQCISSIVGSHRGIFIWQVTTPNERSRAKKKKDRTLGSGLTKLLGWIASNCVSFTNLVLLKRKHSLIWFIPLRLLLETWGCDSEQKNTDRFRTECKQNAITSIHRPTIHATSLAHRPHTMWN